MKNVSYEAVKSPESPSARDLDPLGTEIVPSMSALRRALSVERYGVEDLSVER